MTDTLFSGQVPVAPDAGDGAPGLDLGTTFWVDQDGSCVGVQWRFPNTLPSGTVTAGLYVKDNTVALATATFTSPVAGAYNTATFSSPVALTALVAYVVVIHTPDRYVATNGFFDLTLDSPNGLIHAPASGLDPPSVTGETLRNGLVGVGTVLAYPTDGSGAHACYFVGPVMAAGSATILIDGRVDALSGASATLRRVASLAGATTAQTAATAGLSRVGRLAAAAVTTGTATAAPTRVRYLTAAATAQSGATVNTLTVRAAAARHYSGAQRAAHYSGPQTATAYRG